jgi:putative transposase
MAEKAVARRGVSIALVCRTFGVSETCYRYAPKLGGENEEIADLLVGLTRARKNLGFGLCFLYLRIPMKSAMHSNLKPATDSDLKPAGLAI